MSRAMKRLARSIIQLRVKSMCRRELIIVRPHVLTTWQLFRTSASYPSSAEHLLTSRATTENHDDEIENVRSSGPSSTDWLIIVSLVGGTGAVVFVICLLLFVAMLLLGIVQPPSESGVSAIP